jgi:hypothetical protein
MGCCALPALLAEAEWRYAPGRGAGTGQFSWRARHSNLRLMRTYDGEGVDLSGG